MKISDYYYNGAKGYTYTELNTGKDIYFGEARCAPEDNKFKSEQIGRDLSYMRAILEMQKDELKNAKAELKVIEDFVKSLECYKNFNAADGQDASARCVYRQLNRRRNRVAAAQYDISITEWCISQIVNTGSKLDDILLKLESAIDKGDI